MWRTWAAGAGVLGLVAIAALMIRTLPSLAPGAGDTPAPCVTSAPTQHGSWWIEIGGPGVFFNVEPGTLYAGRDPWLIITRFDPDAGPKQQVAVHAERVASDDRVDGVLNSRMDPGNIYRFSEPAPRLPGGWYLFEQRFPSVGCWRISGAINGQVVGSALIEIQLGHLPSASLDEPPAPTPQIAPSSGASAVPSPASAP